MRHKRLAAILLGMAFLATGSACTGVAAAYPTTQATGLPAAATTLTPSSLPTARLPSVTPFTASPSPLPPHQPTSSATPTLHPLGLLECRIASAQSGTYVPRRMPEICLYAFDFPLSRPIQPPGTDTVEPSYRYGSTQNNQREPHHGVEFINRAGVPVLAAAAGRVMVAGTDEEVKYAAKTNFYGKLVVIEHHLGSFSPVIFTLYGHLLSMNVTIDDMVKAGDKIGEVGLGGVAAGTHLHFEVRYGENQYNASRNPELWLKPLASQQSPPTGVLAGRFVDDQGVLQVIDNIVLQPLDDAGVANGAKIYLRTYEDPAMTGQQPWNENFGAGELNPGNYRMVFVHARPEEFIVTIQPGRLTYLIIQVE